MTPETKKLIEAAKMLIQSGLITKSDATLARLMECKASFNYNELLAFIVAISEAEKAEQTKGELDLATTEGEDKPEREPYAYVYNGPLGKFYCSKTDINNQPDKQYWHALYLHPHTNTEQQTGWIPIESIPNHVDCVILFDTGEVRRYDEKFPFAVATHYFPLPPVDNKDR